MARGVDVTFTVHRIETAFPGKRTWGEAWWTARDICLGNVPEHEPELQLLLDEIHRRLDADFMFGGELWKRPRFPADMRSGER